MSCSTTPCEHRAPSSSRSLQGLHPGLEAGTWRDLRDLDSVLSEHVWELLWPS